MYVFTQKLLFIRSLDYNIKTSQLQALCGEIDILDKQYFLVLFYINLKDFKKFLSE